MDTSAMHPRFMFHCSVPHPGQPPCVVNPLLGFMIKIIPHNEYFFAILGVLWAPCVDRCLASVAK
jgi:hypothetical protein